jgi:mannosyltransferase OCH1-like enzyme
MFDPHYIVVQKQQSAQQTAYDSFYKNNPNCNNIVGDYMGNYKYQTGINKECWQAFAQSRLLTEVVTKTIRECLKVWLETRE